MSASSAALVGAGRLGGGCGRSLQSPGFFVSEHLTRLWFSQQEAKRPEILVLFLNGMCTPVGAQMACETSV